MLTLRAAPGGGASVGSDTKGTYTMIQCGSRTGNDLERLATYSYFFDG